MPLVVDTVARFSINATYFGENVANIWDVRFTNIGAETRADVCQDYAGELLQAVHDRLRSLANFNLMFQSVAWVDLDEPDGSIGSVAVGQGAAAWPAPGTNSGTPSAANLSVLVTKRIVAQRGRRNGRMFWLIGDEGQGNISQPNELTSAQRTAHQTAFDGFFTDASGEMEAPDYTANPCVVKITARDVNGNPTEGSPSDISSLFVETRFATQRGRLRD